jgi:hypothetical protein
MAQNNWLGPDDAELIATFSCSQTLDDEISNTYEMIPPSDAKLLAPIVKPPARAG